MSDTFGLWVGRLVIVVIIVVIGYVIGMFVANIQKNPNESVIVQTKRSSKYEKIGAACGFAIGAIWVLFVAGKDHRQKESYQSLLRKGAYQGASQTPFAI